MEVVALVCRAMDAAEGDVAALHEALFESSDVEDLKLSVVELEELLRAIDAAEAQALEVSLPDGTTVNAPLGAVAAASTPDGARLVVAFDHWLEVVALPTLELERRIPLGRLDGVVDGLTLSPSGRLGAVSTRRSGGGALLVATLADGSVWADPSGCSHPAGPVVFGEDETVVAFVALNPAWRDAVEKERAKEKPWKADFGGVSIGKVGGHGCGTWALWGALPAPEERLSPPPTLGEESVPVFRSPRLVDVTLPTGESLTIDYSTLFRVHAPNPKEFPAVVKHRVRPRERTAAELAVATQPWAPSEPFSAQWVVEPGDALARGVLLLAIRGSVSLVSFPDGELVSDAAWGVCEGWPTDVVVRDDARLAAVVWHRPTVFASGVELFELAETRVRHLPGRGCRFFHAMRRMQPTLIGPVALLAGGDEACALLRPWEASGTTLRPTRSRAVPWRAWCSSSPRTAAPAASRSATRRIFPRITTKRSIRIAYGRLASWTRARSRWCSLTERR
jgi:hypothetical protein